MTVLVMGGEEKEKLHSLKEYAEAHEVSLDDLFDQMNGHRPSVGTMPEYTRYIPDSFKVVYSIEQQPKADVRHCSISCKTKAPAIEAVDMIMKELGYENTLESGNCHVYLEDMDDGKKAVNVIEIIRMRP